jgi:predicted aspartyl protease
MRTLLVALGLALLIPACICVAQDDERPDLQALYKQHQWFDLRSAVDKDSPVFYRAAVDCTFDDVHHCEKEAAELFQIDPHSDESREARDLLASVYLRYGRFREALAQVDAALTFDPENSQAKNIRPLLQALAKFPDESTNPIQYSRLKWKRQDGHLAVPVTIDGKEATYIFDTGANLSLVSESEAKRLGLAAEDVSTKMSTITGQKVPLRFAEANELSAGSLRVKHVAFLVVPDDQPPFNDMPPGERGILGINVLLAFQRFSWAPGGSFEIFPPELKQTHADICFDGQAPVAQIQHEDEKLNVLIDTGAEETYMYPPFADKFVGLLADQGKRTPQTVTGVANSTDVDSSELPDLQLTIGRFSGHVHPAKVLLKETTGSSKFFDGNLGMDLLSQGRKTTIDFRWMTLTIE